MANTRIAPRDSRFPRLGRLCVLSNVVLVVLLLKCSAADACIGSTRSSVFYDFADLAAGIDAPIILDVVVTARSDGERHWGGLDKNVQIGIARVRRVLKGSIASNVIKLRVYPTSCGPNDFNVGASGVVAGTLQRDPEGEFELLTKQHQAYFRITVTVH